MAKLYSYVLFQYQPAHRTVGGKVLFETSESPLFYKHLLAIGIQTGSPDLKEVALGVRTGRTSHPQAILPPLQLLDMESGKLPSNR